ncbi:parp domain-containing protein [Apiospora sp. TS-2023a]
MASTHLFSEDDLIELSFLRDLEVDQLIDQGLLGDHLKLSSPLDEELAFAYDELTLRVLAGPHYPAVAVTWSVEGRHAFSRTAIIDLRALLGQIMEEAAHTNLDKWLERESDASSGIYEPTMVVLSLVKETITHIIAFRQKVEERNPDRYRTKPQLKQVANITQKHSAGIERDTAFELLGKTPAEIIRKIPPPNFARFM